MRIAGLTLALATIVALELIQWIGASFDPPRPPWFGVLTAWMDLGLVASGLILGHFLFHGGRRVLGILFAANPAVMLGALGLRLAGFEFGRGLLFGVGLYWLTLYLVGLSIGWRTILGPPAR